MPLTELRPEDPQQVGPYRLLNRLGSGGMGCVYLGRSPGKRLVAVKVISPELAGDPDFRHRFAREVTAARQVGGVFTAPVVDAEVDGPMPWLATEFVRGSSLAEAVAASGPLPPEQLLDLAAGLAEGLGVIHAAGVVHRDLKPANVILAEDGPRIIDFGISRTAGDTTLTRTGEVIGSVRFMSPEQAEANEAGPASDIFSLGAVLVFAATGRAPFGTGSESAILYGIVHKEPDLGEVTGPLRRLIRCCLAKSPGDRLTARELLAEIVKYQEDNVQLAAPDGPAGCDLDPKPSERPVTVPVRKPPPASAAARPVTFTESLRSAGRRRFVGLLGSGALVAFGAVAALVVWTQPDSASVPSSHPLSAAILTGGWEGRYSVTSSSGSLARLKRGTPIDGAWRFVPGCASGPCPVTLHGSVGDTPFTMSLVDRDTSYSGSAAISYPDCSASNSDRLSLQVTTRKAAVLNRRWVASSWSGVMTMTVPAGACSAGAITAEFSSASPTISFNYAAPTVRSVSPATVASGQHVTVRGSGFGATQGHSRVIFDDHGIGWGLPDNGAVFQIDSWSDDFITFTLPTSSGPGGVWHVWPATTATVAVATADGGISNYATLTIG